MKRLERFGRVRFEITPLQTRGGMQNHKVYCLNEPQATLLITFLKNTDVVADFKEELVRQFYVMRQELFHRRISRAELKPIRRELTDVVQEVDPSPWAYVKYTNLAYKAAVGMTAAQLRKQRGAPKHANAVDYMSANEIAAVSKRQNQIAVLLEMGLDYPQIRDMLLCAVVSQ